MFKKAMHIIKGVLVMTMFVSCQDAPFFIQYHSIPYHSWDKRSKMVFELPNVDHDKDLSLTLGIRATEHFEYSEITLLTSVYEDKKEIVRDTTNMTLFDKDNLPTGNGFPFIETTQKTPARLHLKKGKHYKIKVTHLMRMNPLDDIYNVGITLQ